MTFKIDLKPGDVVTNTDLCALFGCGTQGGMRRSHKTNTLILISQPAKSVYEDRWEDNILHYTGMGLTGDQRLDFAQNKTLAESKTNGVSLHLFEVYIDKSYTYRGQVELNESPYSDTQLDNDAKNRKVWIFPLRITTEHDFHIPLSIISTVNEAREKSARKLTDSQLHKLAVSTKKTTGTRTTSTTIYSRNANVSEYAKRRADGVCQLCSSPAPFSDKNKKPYLETHHIIWRSRGGPDTAENTVALCPNCHRKMHALDHDSDKTILKSIATKMLL